MFAYYIDTSALVKLVVVENGTPAMHRWFAENVDDIASPNLARTELIRMVRRLAPNQLMKAREALNSLVVIRLNAQEFEVAGRLDPVFQHIFDAIHLAAALTLGDDLAGIVTYDSRLADAAHSMGIKVVAPG